MAGYDFNNTSEQSSQERVHGPVPEGSKVLLQLTINQPFNQASTTNAIIDKTKNGLFNIRVTYTVIAGTYQGYKWFDMIMLPPELQRASMTDGQRKSCEISAQRIRGIIEASRNVNPKDTSPAAKSKRGIQSWQELDNMTFPARLSINDKGREYNGNVYYNNRISYVVTPDNKEYSQLMAGGEIINAGGAVVPVAKPPKQPQYQFDDFEPINEATPGEVSGMDDIPF